MQPTHKTHIISTQICTHTQTHTHRATTHRRSPYQSICRLQTNQRKLGPKYCLSREEGGCSLRHEILGVCVCTRARYTRHRRKLCVFLQMWPKALSDVRGQEGPVGQSGETDTERDMGHMGEVFGHLICAVCVFVRVSSIQGHMFNRRVVIRDMGTFCSLFRGWKGNADCILFSKLYDIGSLRKDY